MVKRYQKKDPFQEREAKKYPDPIPSREFILQYLDEIGESVSRQQLLDAFGLESEDQQEAMRRRLIAMVRDGQVIRNRRDRYAIVDEMDLVRGRVLGHREGFGFLVPDDGSKDIFLSPYQMRMVFPDDRVLVRIRESDRRGRREGVIVEILERNTTQVVGRYIVENGLAFVIPDNKNINQDIIIAAGEEAQAKHGQIVVAEVIAQPSVRRQSMGRVIEILGEHMAPGMEIEVAIRSYRLPHYWAEDVLTEVKRLPKEVSEDAIHDRKDLRSLAFVTIDGEDAKDFDDAVYCEPLVKTTGWRLLVAIADVTHYIRPAMALDQEAYRRGNSVYFPGKVIPMLPEALSNHLCSLKPQVDRLCMVCEMQVSGKGELKHYEFYQAVIRSQARLTYTHVAQMLEGRNITEKKLLPHLQHLHELYKKLHKQRKLRGAIEFETTETRIVLDKSRKVKTIMPLHRNDAHRLIEECMLLANVAASKFLLQHKLTVLLRVHEGPDPEKLDILRQFLRTMGLRIGGKGKPKPMDYAKLLQRIEGRPDAHVIQIMLLRSMSQAVYAAVVKRGDKKHSGHFGLAYEAYTHFTSPIRRYPDVLIHRAIKSVITRQKIYTYDVPEIQRFGMHCSSTERRADEATRDVEDWLKCQYMLNKVGEAFAGVISSVTGFGIFVELKDIYVEGLVHISALRNDYYHFDPIRRSLTGKRTATIYKIGDAIRVLVARVDPDERAVDFEVI